MKRPIVVEILLFLGLLVAGVGLRVWMQHLPNFAPVAAISLFAGFFFRSWLVAAFLPVTIMGVSDYFIGGYDPRMMVLVHAALALPVLCRGILRHQSVLGKKQSTTRFFAKVIGASVSASCFFFVATNFGSFLWFDMYNHDFAGLTQCYINALPFFRYTLAGDLFFALVLFGGYSTAVTTGLVTSRSVTFSTT